jgi:hypothetical protein
MWKIVFIDENYTRILKQGHEKDMRQYYDSVYKENRDVYLLLSPQEYNELFIWDF